jgi:hypothetical protein
MSMPVDQAGDDRNPAGINNDRVFAGHRANFGGVANSDKSSARYSERIGS